MRENAFAFRRFREYEQICSCWQGLKGMRTQETVLLQAAPEKEVMMTKQESKYLNYEDYQDFLDAAEGFIRERKESIGNGNHPVWEPARYNSL